MIIFVAYIASFFFGGFGLALIVHAEGLGDVGEALQNLALAAVLFGWAWGRDTRGSRKDAS